MTKAYAMKYPRKPLVRRVLRAVIGFLIHRLGKIEIEGTENIPADGPVIIAGNHFNFIDPPLLIYANTRLTEFIGGSQRPNSPFWAKQIPKWYGFIHAFRSGYGRSTFEQSLAILKQDGVLGIFPEGGSWAALLRPARPGMAYLAVKSRAPIVPVSIIGADSILGGGEGPARIIYHPPLTPPEMTSRGRERRDALDAFSRDVMAVIASGLPDDQRGEFSSCPDARAAAEAVSEFPFDDPEMRGI